MNPWTIVHIQGTPHLLLLRGHEPRWSGVETGSVLAWHLVSCPKQEFWWWEKTSNTQSHGFCSSLPVSYERTLVGYSRKHAHLFLTPGWSFGQVGSPAVSPQSLTPGLVSPHDSHGWCITFCPVTSAWLIFFLKDVARLKQVQTGLGLEGPRPGLS